jgi:hypothetical protein
LNLKELWVKDETCQPTGSLKDRASAIAVVSIAGRIAGVLSILPKVSAPRFRARQADRFVIAIGLAGVNEPLRPTIYKGRSAILSKADER